MFKRRARPYSRRRPIRSRPFTTHSRSDRYWYRQSMLKTVKYRTRSDDTDITTAANQGFIKTNMAVTFDPANAMWKGCGVVGGTSPALMFDEVKVKSMTMYLRLLVPGAQYGSTDTAPEKRQVQILTCYDPDAAGQRFATERDWDYVAHTRRHIWTDLRKEFKVTLYPKFSPASMAESSFNRTLHAFVPPANVWFDIGTVTQSSSSDRPVGSTNAQQIYIKCDSGSTFRQRFECDLEYRGLRWGQTYESPTSLSAPTPSVSVPITGVPGYKNSVLPSSLALSTLTLNDDVDYDEPYKWLLEQKEANRREEEMEPDPEQSNTSGEGFVTINM